MRATIIASGGIATLDDLRAVRAIGCGGAIVGRALLDGSLDLAAALDIGAAWIVYGVRFERGPPSGPGRRVSTRIASSAAA